MVSDPSHWSSLNYGPPQLTSEKAAEVPHSPYNRAHHTGAGLCARILALTAVSTKV